jgi:hypothetical protein
MSKSKMSELPSQPQPVAPSLEWIRLPRAGERCEWTGLSRSKLNELILPCEGNDYHPPVQSICLSKHESGKGARLIRLPSLLGYLRSLIKDAAAMDRDAYIREFGELEGAER